MQKAVSAMFSQIHESLEKGFAQSFAKNGGNGGSSRDSGALLKSLEERVVATAKASEQNMQLMFSKTTQEYDSHLVLLTVYSAGSVRIYEKRCVELSPRRSTLRWWPMAVRGREYRC